jgi:hypothetical protein
MRRVGNTGLRVSTVGLGARRRAAAASRPSPRTRGDRLLLIDPPDVAAASDAGRVQNQRPQMTDELNQRVQNLEQQVRNLQDRAEIREIIARYSYNASRGQCGEAMGALFTEDGVFDARAPGGQTSDILVEGQEKLREFFDKMRPGATTPMIHDMILNLRGDEATGTCVLDSPCYTGERRGYVGYYEDQFRRVGGRWKFKTRVFFFFQGSVQAT